MKYRRLVSSSYASCRPERSISSSARSSPQGQSHRKFAQRTSKNIYRHYLRPGPCREFDIIYNYVAIPENTYRIINSISLQLRILEPDSNEYREDVIKSHHPQVTREICDRRTTRLQFERPERLG